MPNPPWPARSIGQISLSGTQLGQTYVNVLHFQANLATDPPFASDSAAKASFDTFVAAWLLAVQSAYCAMHPNDWLLTLVRAQVLERGGMWRHRLTPTETNITTGGAGNISAGDAENTTPAGVIRWRTALAGKRYRGRAYIGPVSGSWQNNGRLTATAVTAYQAFIDLANNFWESATPGAGWEQCVYSRPYNTGEYQYTVRDSSGLHVVTPAEYAGAATNIEAAAIDPVLRSQRRREIGVGV